MSASSGENPKSPKEDNLSHQDLARVLAECACAAVGDKIGYFIVTMPADLEVGHLAISGNIPDHILKGALALIGEKIEEDRKKVMKN